MQSIPYKLRAGLWLRSALLPDLTRWMTLHRLLHYYTPRHTSPAWTCLSAEEILFHIDHHLAKCRRMRGRRCLRRGLLAFYYLRLAGYPAVIRFGYFINSPGKTKSHCWNTVGELVDDPPRSPVVEILAWRGAFPASSG